MTMLIRNLTTTTTSNTTTTTWNLYENPIYNSSPQVVVHHERLPEEQVLHQQERRRRHDDCHHHHQKFHSIHLPVSARKMAASFWDLTFIRPSFSSHLDTDAANAAPTRITELKTELDYERKARKKMKLTNKRLSAELSEEKKERQVLERICQDLAHKISAHKLDMDRMRRDMEDERKRLHVAEVFREERVRMKLADAKFLLDSKLLELDRHQVIFSNNNCILLSSSTASTSRPIIYIYISTDHHQEDNSLQTIGTCPQVAGCSTSLSSAEAGQQGGGDQLEESISSGSSSHVPGDKRRSEAPSTLVDSSSSSHLAKWISSIQLPEPENPHTNRVSKTSRRRSRHLSSAAGGSKLECQKAQQLGILLKQKCITSLPSSTNRSCDILGLGTIML